MKSPSRPQSATSLPRAPRDDAGARLAKYMGMMGVRIGCFLAMVLVTPYGWYTWLFGAGAIVLPYLAVVVANVGQEGRRVVAVNPERTLSAPVADEPAAPPDSTTTVIRIQENPRPSAPEDRDT